MNENSELTEEFEALTYKSTVKGERIDQTSHEMVLSSFFFVMRAKHKDFGKKPLIEHFHDSHSHFFIEKLVSYFISF